MATATQSALADALVADGPDPEHAEALMLFGRFVGEWEFDWTAERLRRGRQRDDDRAWGVDLVR
jgi:hypothetical protein